MDKIWDRKSFEVGGHWPLWRRWKKRMTTQNRQKSNAKKQQHCSLTTLSFCVNVLDFCNNCVISQWICVILTHNVA